MNHENTNEIIENKSSEQIIQQLIDKYTEDPD